MLMQYELIIAFRLSVDAWTLFYCLLCTVCFIVCCNPAFLAAKSNKGYYLFIYVVHSGGSITLVSSIAGYDPVEVCH